MRNNLIWWCVLDKRLIVGIAIAAVILIVAVFAIINYDNDKIIRNFVPALDTTNKPCLYDTVSKQPFYNHGTGEFLYG